MHNVKILSKSWMLVVVVLAVNFSSKAQHINELTATLDHSNKSILVQQNFTYVNTSGESLQELYFNDWNNAYSSNTTPLAKRFGEDFNRSLHLAKPDERGYTKITSIVRANYSGLDWQRTKNQDIVKVTLNESLDPKDSIQLFMTYTLRIPDDKFTKYGYDDNGNYFLKDWYLSPAVYNKGWKLYSNKGLEDLYTEPTNTIISFIFPSQYHVASNFKTSSVSEFPRGKQVILQAENRKNCDVVLTKAKQFVTHSTNYLTVTTNLNISRFDRISQGISIEKVSKFLSENLGNFPHDNLLVSDLAYSKNPLYGLNQLPSFVRPYDEQFQFELAFLKTTLNTLLPESVYLDPRKERWVNDAIAYHLMIKYVEDFYPDEKLMGKLSKIWGIRGFQLAKKDFNEQYYWLQMFSARSNIDQALNTSNDSLIVFNQKIANRYKAGLGLEYLGDYIGFEKVENIIYDFYERYKLKPHVGVQDFKMVLDSYASKNIDWFFDEYVNTRDKIDYKIKKVEKTEDSITFVLKNKRKTNFPISLFGLQKDSVVSKYWFSDVDSTKTFTIPRNGEDRLVLNYDKIIPEYNQRDNWKTLNGFFSSNKKLQFRFFKDAEDPYYNQIFYVPIANFNIYDGITPGMRLYNKTFVERAFTYDISPTYSFNEKTIVGGASLRYRKYHGKSGHYVTNVFLSGGTSHFEENSRFTTITPGFSLGWRPDDLRSNKRQFLQFRYRNVLRSIGENVLNNQEIDLDLENNPDYSVLNLRYINRDNNIIDYKASVLDLQHSSEFTKLSMELEYRKLFISNRQLNLRFYAGKFLRNKTNSDFFSFALDRPTDYMFDLGYLGRSETSGLTSQQIIIAEGGFKSLFDDQFGSDWIATTNASINVWRWIELYGDVGFIGDRGESARFVYDSGIRLNLVTDYFELYLPVYSNKGWEIAQPDYEKTIRFIVTVSPRTLVGLFTRKWF